MNISEIDFRIDSVHEILTAVSAGIKAVEDKYPAYEVKDETPLEHIEDLRGIAFVTAQTYISGTLADVAEILADRPAPSKQELLRSCNPVVADTNLTRMELCDVAANYYKHRDEWGCWSDATGIARRTIDQLQRTGFGDSDSFVCTKVSQLLLGTVHIHDLTPFSGMLSEWRQQVILNAASASSDP